MDKKLIIFFLLLLIVISSVMLISFKPYRAKQPITVPLQTNATKFKTLTISDKSLRVEYASTLAEWSKGLSNRISLEKDNGMIFVFPTAQIQNFWMKDTIIPLDIIWVANHKVVGFDHMFPELDTPIEQLKHFYSPSAVDVVIETNLNWTISNNIKIGDVVTYSN
ncbi:MAG: DUF192 domain-containing protein [bacterium]|nr:DUF192 domain-containing protein [bacterium]